MMPKKKGRKDSDWGRGARSRWRLVLGAPLVPTTQGARRRGVEHAHVGCILMWSLTTITLLCGELVRPRLEGRVIPKDDCATST